MSRAAGGGRVPALVALLAAVVSSAGCAGRAGGPEPMWLAPRGGEPSGVGCAGAEAGLDAAALGIAGFAPPPGPFAGKDVTALAALVDPHLAAFTAPPVADGQGDAFAAGEVAGAPPCPGLDEGRLLVEGQPARLRFVPAAAPVAAQMARGDGELAAGRAPEARIAYAAARAADVPGVLGPALAIARSYAHEARWREAIAAFRELLPQHGRHAAVHAGLGDMLRRAEDRGEAADAWARAVALAPGALPLVRRVAQDPFVEVRSAVPPPATRAADGRWTLRPPPSTGPGGSPEAITAARSEAAAYAHCKEAFRQSEPLRVAVGAPGSPWRWSPGEEAACTAIWLRAYQRHRDAGRPEDSGLDDLLAIAQRGFLLERGIFDVGGRAHPQALLLMEEGQRARLIEYVRGHRVVRKQQGGWLF